MDEAAKKTSLRMIPYGLFVVTTGTGRGRRSDDQLDHAGLVPAAARRARHEGRQHDARSREGQRHFAVNVLGAGQKDCAFAFFKPTQVEGNKLSGYETEAGSTGAPLLLDAPAWFECRLTDVVERGDHHVVVAEVLDAGVRRESAPLTLAECGVFYGG